jgi:flavin reductase (DIM6/NTAB) family NADH-FMN oxidoreductase RutF
MNAPLNSHPKDGCPAIDPATFRLALGRFVTGVTVMTTRCPRGVTAGVTVSSFNTLSLDPPLILWSLSLRTPSLKVFRDSDRFAVNILADDQSSIAMQFARPAPDKFANIGTSEGLVAVPLIDGAVAHIECAVENRYPGGDHELIIGRIIRATATERTPLVYGQGKFGNFSVSATSN